MIVDGRALAKGILARTKVRAETLSRRPRVVAYLAEEPSGPTLSYLKIKEQSAVEAGCDFEVVRSTESFAHADAVIVQLPLLASVNQQELLDSIPIDKDADVLSSAARERFEKTDLRYPYVLPPVVGAVREILQVGNVVVAGKKVIVVGSGFLVGGPVAIWLKQQGAEVEIVTLESNRSLTSVLQTADIVVSGAGSPHLIKPDMIQQGLALIDAGTSESNGKVVGDADPACASKCSLFTPVPGGVGPIAVACLFANVVTLADRNNRNML